MLLAKENSYKNSAFSCEPRHLGSACAPSASCNNWVYCLVCEITMVLLELIVDTQFIMLFLAGYLEEKFGQQCLLASKSVVPERRKSKEKEEQSFTHTKAKKARFKLYDRAGMLQSCPDYRKQCMLASFPCFPCPCWTLTSWKRKSVAESCMFGALKNCSFFCYFWNLQ